MVTFQFSALALSHPRTNLILRKNYMKSLDSLKYLVTPRKNKRQWHKCTQLDRATTAVTKCRLVTELEGLYDLVSQAHSMSITIKIVRARLLTDLDHIVL